MRRYILTFAASIITLFASAQIEVLKINLGDTVVTYKVSDIQDMTFDIEEEQVDTTLFHCFNGYIFVSTKYFQDSYYGDEARLCVYKTSKGEYIVTFSDPTWGEAMFFNVSVGRELSGSGTFRMNSQQGDVKEYDATISGPMTTPTITIPDVMGGTTITFHVGEPPVAYHIVGKYQGNISVIVGGQFGPYVKEGGQYDITANSDGTINVAIPEFELAGTVMGDLTLGAYTISNIAYDEGKGTFFRDYTGDDIVFHLKAVSDGNTTMDNDYSFTKLGSIEIKATENGIVITNSFQPGSMPFPIVSTFEGTKASTF